MRWSAGFFIELRRAIAEMPLFATVPSNATRTDNRRGLYERTTDACYTLRWSAGLFIELRGAAAEMPLFATVPRNVTHTDNRRMLYFKMVRGAVADAFVRYSTE